METAPGTRENQEVILLTKGDFSIETTYNQKDEAGAENAYEHAIAQAWAHDNSEQEKRIRENTANDQSPVEERMRRAVRKWEREG